MILKKIYFDSFKSLVNEQILIKNNCTGIVGINESGKSNILQAIRILNDEHKLDRNHVPKIRKSFNPKLRFEFEPREDQYELLKSQIQSWLKTNSLIEGIFDDITFNIEFEIEFNLETNIESRKFKVHVLDFNLDEFLVLDNNFFNDEYFIFNNNDFLPIQSALLVPKETLYKSEEDLKAFKELVNSIKDKLKILKEKRDRLNKKENLSDDESVKLIAIREEIQEEENNLSHKQAILNKFDIERLIEDSKKEITYLEEEINKNTENIDNYLSQINTLKSKPRANYSVTEKGNFTRFTNSLKSSIEKLEILKRELENKKEIYTSLVRPLNNKYIQNHEPLSHYISQLLEEDLIEYLPKVVFWEYSNDFILKSKTKFSEILDAKKLSQISRPLLNIFRIGLKINSLEEIKDKLKIIQGDDGERTRFADLLNDRINTHIHDVWEDYDQNVKISVEEHQIRIEFFDPAFKGKSYFNMDEKSQGAQTFLSFLMTIGAEAAHGVLNNTILLLDEPETHLHPSGVRYMLKELIKISEKNNIVIYATHSIFMIDTDNYERHIYLVKKDEKTSINLSEKNRIGYFLQEEVLFGALDFDLEKDLNTRSNYNFVFEGEGDVLLFSHFYEYCLTSKDQPFDINKSKFFQGGKCSDIIKFLKKNPIKLGTKWIFIIDNDYPANQLKQYILNQYKNYIDKEVFVFQYDKSDNLEEVQLEDLLSDKLLKDVYAKTSQFFNLNFDMDKIDLIKINELNYSNYHSKILDLLEIKDNNYKGEWKNKLNQNIEEELKNLKSKELFEKKIPQYSAWADEVIKSLGKNIKL